MSQQMPGRLSGGAIDLSHLVAARSGAQQPPQQGSPGGPAAAGAPGAPGAQVVDVPSLVLDADERSFEQLVQLSSVVPIVLDMWAEWCQPCKTLGPVLEQVTREFGGALLLAKIDIDANPGLKEAFQVQSIPAVFALVAGRPVPLFQGAVPEQQVREVFGQLVQLAVQQGVVGRVNAPDAVAGVEPAEAPVNPAHAEALEAIDRGDYAAAVRSYEQVLLKAPADHEARAALVQVKLLDRLQGRSADEIRAAAGAGPDDVDAQLAVADLDVSGGHVEDAFLRLLELFAGASAEDRARVRERLLELFEVVGQSDARVAAARNRLANLLY